MTHYQQILKIPTTGSLYAESLPKIEDIVAIQVLNRALWFIFLRHTSASLLIQENADPDIYPRIWLTFGWLY
jgi:thiamine phosphate synthase YjbQ (UPF0047 family)